MLPNKANPADAPQARAADLQRCAQKKYGLSLKEVRKKRNCKEDRSAKYQ